MCSPGLLKYIVLMTSVATVSYTRYTCTSQHAVMKVHSEN